jgi:hypothetical protein
MLACKVHVTSVDGSEAHIEGDYKVVCAVERSLSLAGARWNAGVECWDFGFYQDTKAPARKLPSILQDILDSGKLPAKLRDELASFLVEGDASYRTATE